VAVYVKDDPAAPAAGTTWKRFLLDVYGDPNENGEGPGHQIVCADFDNDGEDEFLVATLIEDMLVAAGCVVAGGGRSATVSLPGRSRAYQTRPPNTTRPASQ